MAAKSELLKIEETSVVQREPSAAAKCVAPSTVSARRLKGAQRTEKVSSTEIMRMAIRTSVEENSFGLSPDLTDRRTRIRLKEGLNPIGEERGGIAVELEVGHDPTLLGPIKHEHPTQRCFLMTNQELVPDQGSSK